MFIFGADRNCGDDMHSSSSFGTVHRTFVSHKPSLRYEGGLHRKAEQRHAALIVTWTAMRCSFETVFFFFGTNRNWEFRTSHASGLQLLVVFIPSDISR